MRAIQRVDIDARVLLSGSLLRGRYCCADATAYVAEIRIIGPMLHRVCQDLLTCRKSVTKLTHFLKMCLMIKFGLGKPSVLQNAGITFL